MTADTAVCVCGHPYRDHVHLRAGDDCWRCGPLDCPAFRRKRWWRRTGVAR
jgi:hypothetical protein